MGIKEKIENWSVERSIDGYENRFQQLVKLSEEVGELSGAVLKQREEEIIDAIGDIQVVLIILSKQLGVDYEGALESAWEVIKNRKGSTINGTFIKSE